VADALTEQELRELSRLFSSMIGNIHSLPANQTQVLLEVDEHMRGDNLTRTDLDRLRSIADHVRP
jgi:hypothetical protein